MANPLKGRVERVREFEGCSVMGYLAHGHVDKAQFCAEVHDEFEEDYPADRVRHEYARNVPVGRDSPGMQTMYFYNEPGRGAFAVTHIDLMRPG